jgi:putative oxidoreductase
MGADGSVDRPAWLIEIENGESAMREKDNPPKPISSSGLLPRATAGATLLRLTLAAFWIVHWWFKVGFRGMSATESFFIHQGLPAWLAWLDISFEVVVASCLILGIYVPLICLVSLPILVASMFIYAGNGFYFPTAGIELPIFWALVQIVQALLGPGVFRITPPNWLPRFPFFLGP